MAMSHKIIFKWAQDENSAVRWSLLALFGHGESVMRAKADVRHPLQVYGLTP
jgi:hypothetical protein